MSKTIFLFLFTSMFHGLPALAQDTLKTGIVMARVAFLSPDEVKANNGEEFNESKLTQTAEISRWITPQYIKIAMAGKDVEPKTAIRDRAKDYTTQLTLRMGEHIKSDILDKNLIVEITKSQWLLNDVKVEYVDSAIYYMGRMLKRVKLNSSKYKISTDAWYDPNIILPALSNEEIVSTGFYIIEAAPLIPFFIFKSTTTYGNGMLSVMEVTNFKINEKIPNSVFEIPSKYQYK